jgi:multisubunit Na+/H+ antiporter MnhC subunit
MDETTKIQHRTFGWPVIVALIVLAVVIGFAVFGGVVNP